MTWAIGGLGYGEKVISIDVSRKLREDHFFQCLLTGMKDWRGSYGFFFYCSGQVILFCFVLFCLENGPLKNRGENTSLQRLVDNGCHCRKHLVQTFNTEGGWNRVD